MRGEYQENFSISVLGRTSVKRFSTQIIASRINVIFGIVLDVGNENQFHENKNANMNLFFVWEFHNLYCNLHGDDIPKPFVEVAWGETMKLLVVVVINRAMSVS